MAEVTGETVNQENTENTPERTFTQKEMNAIIGERLERERAKYADYNDLKAKAEKFDAAEEAAKSDLQKATERADELKAQLDSLKKEKAVREIREKVSKETGVPVAALSGEDEESCKAQAKAIMEYAHPEGYPQVPDKGEVIHTGKKSNRDLFSDWMNQNIH